MNKLVTRINWVNDTDPAINDTHLNQMDSELDAIDDRVIGLEGACETQAEEAEAWAVGERGGEAVQSGDPTFHNNSKYYSHRASNSATNAGTSETNAGNSATAAGNSATAAGNSALVSEGYAKGTQNGVPVTSGPYFENNAEFFKNQAQQIAGAALGGLSDVTITTPTNGQVLTYDADNNIWRNSDGGSVEMKSGNPLSLTTDSAQVSRGTTITLNPIQASGTPTPSNPIPIYGYDAVEIEGHGVNQWDEEWEVGTLDGGTGEPLSYANRIRSKNFCICTGNTSFYAKIGFNVSLKIFWYNSNKSFISAQVLANTTIISPVQAAYFKITVEGSTYGETYRNDISINYPSSDTTYHAYTQSEDISLLLPETVYGGTLDVESGMLTVNSTMVDMGDLEWTLLFGNTFRGTLLKQCLNTSYDDSGNTKSSIYATAGWGAVIDGATDKTICVRDVGVSYCAVCDTNYSDATTFKTAVTGQKLIYDLATPYTIQLIPEQISLLLGSNVLTSNGSLITVIYRGGKIAMLSDMALQQEGLDNRLDDVTETLSGNPVRLGTAIKSVARSTEIVFKPIQSSGTPTPSNPLAISGYSKAELRVTGKNQFNPDWLLNATGWSKNGSEYSGQIAALFSYSVTNGFPVLSYSNSVYTISYKIKKATTAGTNPRFAFVYTDGTSSNASIDNLNTNWQTCTLTSTSGKTVQKLICDYTSAEAISLKEIQLELCSTATAYEPYTEATDISETLTSTIYGGTLDVETGVLSVTHKIRTLNGSENWDTSGNCYYIEVADEMESGNVYLDSVCNIATADTWQNVSASSGTTFTYYRDAGWSQGHGRLGFNNQPYGTLEAFKTALGSNNAQVVTRLVTPITIQLTPHQVRLLEGSNVITSNGTTITVMYREGEIASLADLEGMAKTINEVAEIANGTKSADQITAGTFSGPVKANPTAMANLGTAQVRNIIVTDTAPTVGSSTTIPDGTLIIVYE